VRYVDAAAALALLPALFGLLPLLRSLPWAAQLENQPMHRPQPFYIYIEKARRLPSGPG
jgi:hypothetical protein